jgi:hypothetical protein
MVTSWGEIRLRLALELLRSPAPEVQLRGRTFDVRALCREAADELTVSFFWRCFSSWFLWIGKFQVETAILTECVRP